MDVDFCIDEITGTGAYGWAWSPTDPNRPLSIELVDENGTIRAHAVADIFREDLAAHGKRGGWCGFAIPIDATLPSGSYSLQAGNGAEVTTLGDPFLHSGAPVADEGASPAAPGPVSGYYDGIRGQEIAGWAYRPDRPDEPVEIEICIDGIVFSTTEANIYRADLRIAGLGHGRYGWRARFPRIPTHQTVQVVVRERGGDPLENGTFRFPYQPTAEDLDDPEIRAFVDAVFATERASPALSRPEAAAAHFLIHAPETADVPIVDAFRAVLETIGHVHMVDDPAGWQTDALLDAAIARGESCTMLSFATPDEVPLGLRCPVVPMFAWDCSTLPDRPRDDTHGRDWRHVLRHTGRAIVFSDWAAAAVRAELGADYPAAAIPAPLWDREPAPRTIQTLADGITLSISGVVADTRAAGFAPDDELPSPPDAAAIDEQHTIRIDGIVFTMLLSPDEDTKYWLDILSAFLTAHREEEDATLLVRMTGSDLDIWWWDFHEMIARQPAAACRVVILQGELDEDGERLLVAGSHWIVNAPPAEGQCLPLQRYMAAGRPAIAPAHTAMADYISPSNALIVAASEEYGVWPHDSARELITTRYRIDWESLRDGFLRGYEEATSDPKTYRNRAEAARDAMERYCSDAIVAAKLDAFLGLGLGLAASPAPPSALLAEARAA
ncbi:hypothetical protein DMC47_43735 [Nostoc sp. 3335mG]|nr:hypothetical protein DMC47_43735 [Nostoc sp. 3335mG]